MSHAPHSPGALAQPPSHAKVLRQLYLTLFLRGYSARGLKKEKAPKSVGSRLALTLLVYFFVGMIVIAFRKQPVFALSIYLHAMSFAFIGMLVAGSAGDMLFNREESDILLHRPVSARSLLWAKVRVLVEISLWLGFAFNFTGLVVGVYAPGGGWWFPLAHAISTVFQTLFCTGSVVLIYELCLRWFGRERLDALMTTSQVVLSVSVVLAAQLLPRMLDLFSLNLHVSEINPWTLLLPPTWFAGLDNILMGNFAFRGAILAGAAVFSTSIVLWLAFGKLAHAYGRGLQTLNERPDRPKSVHRQNSFLSRIVSLPPICWWLRNPVERASFLLAAAYLLRDRETKLRVYPGIAPLLVLPIIMLFDARRTHGAGASFTLAFTGAYIALVAPLAIGLLQHSSHWRAADIFRAAPLEGPWPLQCGSRRAATLLLAPPMALLVGALAWALTKQWQTIALVLPGLIVTPLAGLSVFIGRRAAPFSVPPDEVKSANRGAVMIAISIASLVVAGLSSWAWNRGWFGQFIAAEALVVGGIYFALRASLSKRKWGLVLN
ncbi:MAG: hypothetical protein QM790_06530 [Nibricoccus sp.]